MDNKELPKYINRAVADIARKCHCHDQMVWLVMYMLSKEYYNKHKNL